MSHQLKLKKKLPFTPCAVLPDANVKAGDVPDQLPSKEVSAGKKESRENEVVPKEEDVKGIPIEYEESPFGGKRVKMNVQPILPHEIPLPQNNSFAHLIITGPTGTGKTQLLLTILPRYKNVSGVICCSNVFQPIFQQIKQYCDEQGFSYHYTNQADHAYELLTEEVDKKKEGTHTLIIFDDVQTGKDTNASSHTLENKVINQVFKESRNFICDAIFIIQTLKTVPTTIRNNTNAICVFKSTETHNVRVVNSFLEDFTGWQMETIKRLFKDMGNDIHSYLFFTKEPKVYMFQADQWKKGDVIKPYPVQEQNEDTDETFELNDFPFDKICEYLTKNDNFEIQSFFSEYLKLLRRFKKINPEIIKQTMKNKYNIELVD